MTYGCPKAGTQAGNHQGLGGEQSRMPARESKFLEGNAVHGSVRKR